MFLSENLQQNAPNTALLVIIGAIILILLLVFIFWLLNRSGREPDEAREERTVRQENTTADDLTRIEGIGPKVAKVLQEAGIRTFEALADADSAQVQEALNAAGLQMMKPEGWIEQAKLAARADWYALEHLQSELKGGRRQ
jgi:FtsZ-interacting cell division protein ZipA